MRKGTIKIKKITEVGVAVRDLEKSTRHFVDVLGAKPKEIITVKRYQMRYRMCRLGQVDFEIMEPIGDEGIMADFIKKRGEGLHHVAFGVESLGQTLTFLKERGVRLIDQKPQDLHGAKFAFVHPSSFSGVMIELIEYPEGFDLP